MQEDSAVIPVLGVFGKIFSGNGKFSHAVWMTKLIEAMLTVAFLPMISGGGFGSSRSTPVAQFDLEDPAAAMHSTIAFPSEDTIAVSRFPGLKNPNSRSVYLIKFRNQKLQFAQPISNFSIVGKALYGIPGGNMLYGVSNSNILIQIAPKVQLWSLSARELEEIPIGALIAPTLRSSLIAEWININQWRLYRLGSTPSLVRAGYGEILSVSDDFLAIRGDHQLRIENATDGLVVGSFQVTARSVCEEEATILGRDRLMLTECNKDRVVDFRGKQLSQLPQRNGWGRRHGASADGTRVLFDDFTRAIPLAQRFAEFFESLISLGMGPNVESNGEEIRVVDTQTGGICFDLESRNRILGTAGEYHADLSPSGTYVAALDGSRVSLYHLPESCPTR